MLEVSVPIAYELLAQCIKQGQALIQRASLVGDFSDYESWKSARKQWIDPTTQALAHMYDGAREARDFAETVICPEGSKRWQDQYAADLDCVKRAIELLTLLQGELAFDAQRPASPELSPSTSERVDRADAAERISATATQLEPHIALSEPFGDTAPERGVHAENGAYTGQREEADEDEDADADATTSIVVDADTAAGGEHDANDERRFATTDEQSAQPERSVGSELAARPLLTGAQLAAQEDVAVPEEHVETSTPEPTRTRQVLLAHGRDERWRHAVEHLLEQAGSHELTVLDERPEERARLLEDAGEQHGTRYAIVLLTAEDIGARRLESAEEPFFTPRAPQEVVFEMGFLVGALTPGRVCVLYEEGVELPCELDAISHVRLDLAGTWQPKLLMKLRRAGFDYDLNRLVSI